MRGSSIGSTTLTALIPQSWRDLEHLCGCPLDPNINPSLQPCDACYRSPRHSKAWKAPLPLSTIRLLFQSSCTFPPRPSLRALLLEAFPGKVPHKVSSLSWAVTLWYLLHIFSHAKAEWSLKFESSLSYTVGSRSVWVTVVVFMFETIFYFGYIGNSIYIFLP